MSHEASLLRKLALLSLILNGLSATAGGAALILAPDGSLLGMPLSFLEGSPFPDYRVPGLVLFLFNPKLALGCVAKRILAR